MDNKSIMDQSSGQTSASIIGLVKESRVTACNQRINYLKSLNRSALSELEATEKSIETLIDSNRGGLTGIHGFIGERAQVGVSNARDVIAEKQPIYRLIDDNGMTDYMRGNTPIQQKACISDKAFGLTHVAQHSSKYPEFVEVAKGVYQIPKDFYGKYKVYSNMSSSEAGKLCKEELRQWSRVQRFKVENPQAVVEPMALKYDEIQAGTIKDTLSRERDNVEKVYQRKKSIAVKAGNASIKEGVACTATSAVLEAAVGGGMSLYKHTKGQNKHMKELKKEEWQEIGRDTLKSAGKGTIRGASVYGLTNCIGMSSNWACATVTATIGTAETVYKYSKGELSQRECVGQLLEVTSDAAVSAACAQIGKKIIPIPVVGELVGSFAGMCLWAVAKDTAVNMYQKRQIKAKKRVCVA